MRINPKILIKLLHFRKKNFNFFINCILDDRPCIIGVLSTFKSGKNKLEMEILENAKNNFSRDYNWAWLDGNCHPEFLKPLRLKAE